MKDVRESTCSESESRMERKPEHYEGRIELTSTLPSNRETRAAQ
jgi:hypothetical protein